MTAFASVHTNRQKKGVAVCSPATTVKEIDALVTLFERIAREEGWQPGDALHTWRNHSVYFALWHRTNSDAERVLVGGLQLVRPQSDGRLPCHEVWPELAGVSKASDGSNISGADTTSIAHIAVMALTSTERARRASPADPFAFWLVCAQMWRYCVQEGVQELWLEVTPKTYRCYERLGWTLVVRGSLREHWGEPSPFRHLLLTLAVCPQGRGEQQGRWSLVSTNA